MIKFSLNGKTVTSREGCTVAAAIANTGANTMRQSVKGGPRGPLCGMGICFECAVTLGGQQHIRSCQLPLEPGMVVETCGSVQPHIYTSATETKRPASRSFDVLIIGGGPAGIAAAIAASKTGLAIGIVDDNPAAGGQIWRKERNAKLAEFAACTAELLPGTRIVDAPQPGVLIGESGSQILELRYGKLILATGARELFLPFPGWTLPNVFGAGGLQALVKGGLAIQDKRVVVAGSGPLLVAVAETLQKYGANIVAIVEQASLSSAVHFGLELARQPAKIGQAAKLLWALRSVAVYRANFPVQAEGSGKLERIVLRGQKTIHCDYLACGFGLVPNNELAALAGCQLHGNFVKVDELQQTSMENIYAVGELTGIGGVEKSLVEGSIAGLAAVGDTKQAKDLFAKREDAIRFQAVLEKRFALCPELLQLASADTTICRCEDVTKADIEQHNSWREAKLHTRCGMGACQGRVCGPAIELIKGWRPESIRPPLSPVNVGTFL